MAYRATACFHWIRVDWSRPIMTAGLVMPGLLPTMDKILSPLVSQVQQQLVLDTTRLAPQVFLGDTHCALSVDARYI